MRIILSILLQLGLASAAIAQQPLPPELSGLAGGLGMKPPLPSPLAAYLRSWIEPTEPFKIVGPIDYVGTRGHPGVRLRREAGTRGRGRRAGLGRSRGLSQLAREGEGDLRGAGGEGEIEIE